MPEKCGYSRLLCGIQQTLFRGKVLVICGLHDLHGAEKKSHICFTLHRMRKMRKTLSSAHRNPPTSRRDRKRIRNAPLPTDPPRGIPFCEILIRKEICNKTFSISFSALLTKRTHCDIVDLHRCTCVPKRKTVLLDHNKLPFAAYSSKHELYLYIIT